MNTTPSRTPLDRCFLAAAIVAGLAGAAIGQTDPKPLLSGPSVEPTSAPDTLVRRGFDGEMERVRGMPEVEAIELLELNAADRAAVDAVLDARAATIDAIVRTHMTTVNNLVNARRAGDRESMREAMQTLRPALEPVLAEGPLVDQLAAAMPEASRTRYREVVAEYHHAARAAARERRLEERGGDAMDAPRRRPGRGAGPDGDGGDWMEGPLGGLGGDAAPGERERRELDRPRRNADRAERGPRNRGAAMRGLMMEVGQSYARLIEDAQAQKGELDDLLGRLDLSAEQRQAIEAKLREAREARLAAGEGMQPDRQGRRQVMRAIAEELDAEQRRAFRGLLRERRAGRP